MKRLTESEAELGGLVKQLRQQVATKECAIDTDNHIDKHVYQLLRQDRAMESQKQIDDGAREMKFRQLEVFAAQLFV